MTDQEILDGKAIAGARALGMLVALRKFDRIPSHLIAQADEIIAAWPELPDDAKAVMNEAQRP